MQRGEIVGKVEKNTDIKREIGSDPRGGSLLYAKVPGERRRGQTRKNHENKRGIAGR